MLAKCRLYVLWIQGGDALFHFPVRKNERFRYKFVAI